MATGGADAFVAELCERVRESAARGRALRVRGGGTKDFYGEAPRGELLEMGAYKGVVAYEPRELVLTVRAGTPLAEVESIVDAERQMLPFEPPHFGAAATIGGVVAAGLSGPRRPYAGAVRDFVLGTRVVNGKGEDLSFGGRVIKNVAGYDVSRLMAGSLGTLAVITQVSFKVLPRPRSEATLRFEMDEGDAIVQANAWAGQPLPISATAWQDGVLRVRLSGAEPAVAAARAKMGGELVSDDDAHWEALREHELPFFDAASVWRVSVPQTCEPLRLGAPQLVEWGGGLRWVAGELDALALRSTVERAGGHATLFRARDKSAGAFHPLRPAIHKLHHRLKQAFDPAGILNPCRMYDF
jgi:glycolate oxidase FAD binding subunit